MMQRCDGCGTEFDDSVDLFPRLIVSKEVQVARRLAEKEDEEDMLCLECWLEAIEHVNKKQLAMLLLGMLRKIEGLQDQIARKWSLPRSPEIVEKEAPYVKPWVTAPNSNPIWISDPDEYYRKRYGSYVGDPPASQSPTTIGTSDNSSYSIQCKSVSPEVAQRMSQGMSQGSTSFSVAGRWAEMVQ
jgi:hypothetical protein